MTSKYVIVLPKDPDRITQLKLKLIQYCHRVLSDPANLDAEYKFCILNKLLKDGAVDTKAVSMEIFCKDGFVDVPTFANAAAVIEDYVLTGGQGVYFGGLPTINQMADCPTPA